MTYSNIDTQQGNCMNTCIKKKLKNINLKLYGHMITVANSVAAGECGCANIGNILHFFVQKEIE